MHGMDNRKPVHLFNIQTTVEVEAPSEYWAYEIMTGGDITVNGRTYEFPADEFRWEFDGEVYGRRTIDSDMMYVGED